METPVEGAINTVTIPADEYYNLRQQADLNSAVIWRVQNMECRLHDIEQNLAERVYRLEEKIKAKKWEARND